MTGDEHIEKATGIVNGANVSFSVSRAYQAGTLYVLANGQLRSLLDDDAWTESNPSAGEFEMLEPPQNDKLFVRYIEA